MKKFLPMGMMMFCVLFNYTTLRNLKDSLVITAAGAEVVPFLKGWIILPISILFVALYTKLLNSYSQKSLFYGIISVFLIYFSIFALYIYPNKEILHPDPEYINALKAAHPHFQHLIALYGGWSFTTLYLFAESWGAIALGLLFWQFANEYTSTTEAKRFYGMFAFLGHFALIFAGWAATYFCSLQENTPPGVDPWSQYLSLTVIAVNICGFAMLGLYWYLHKYVLSDPKYVPAKNERKSDKPKLKLTVVQSFKEIFQSKYIGLIAILVFGYGFTMNLMGIMWKNQVKLQYPNAIEYADFMGSFYMWTGIITVTILFFFKGAVANFGWFRGAIITPMAILITSVLFFLFIFFQDLVTPLVAVYGMTPLILAVYVSTMQQIMSKSCKYSLFDPTKEMAYIPLDPELKTKGKAAVDVTGHLFSKASGGYFSGILLMVTAASDLMTIAPVLAVAVLATVILWVVAVFKLNSEYNARVTEKEREIIPAADFMPAVGNSNTVRKSKSRLSAAS